MYNHTVMRLAYRPIFLVLFAGGICAGSIMVLLFCVMDRTLSGFFGGTFLSLLLGLASGILGLIYTAVFNTLAPVIGGIKIKIEPSPVPVTENPITQPPDSPSH
ncbi:MAG: hypothetical protein H7X79_11860 [Sporomusaceae bacterium]|nr:hypothetical protein [Sporomusaceae bacterium]